MATMDESLRARIAAAPAQRYHAIVRTDADASALAASCASEGMTVHHTFRLVPGLSVTARGDALLALAQHPHVTRIEPDREVGVAGC